MSVQRIASRYAKSLLDLAKEQGKLDVILDDIKDFKKSVENRDLYLLLKSPIINPGKKLEVFRAIFGEKYDKITNGFFEIAIRKSRESYLPEMAESFLLQYKKMNKISTVHITTAEKLTEEGLAQIKAKLEINENTDENLEFVTTIDPSIIGGFIIEFDDRLYDASVAHKLDELKKSFSGNKYIAEF